ncbi:MAG: YraN family protein [Armatimonadota bacterium]
MRWPWSRRVLTRNELGALGERHAARALRAAGLQIIEGNYRTKRGELDLIAREGDTLVFVEVRTRTSTHTQTPLASVDAAKQARIIRLAHRYRQARRLPECSCRYDVVEVLATAEGEVQEVRHVPGAFIPGM